RVYLRDRVTHQTMLLYDSNDYYYIGDIALSADARFVAFNKTSSILGSGYGTYVCDRSTGVTSSVSYANSPYGSVGGAKNDIERPSLGTAAIAAYSRDYLQNGLYWVDNIYAGRLTQTAVPGIPTGLTGTVAGSTVSLAWNAGSGEPALAFVIEAGST